MKTKKQIQLVLEMQEFLQNANLPFPRREIWVKDDRTFWVFDIVNENIVATDGTYVVNPVGGYDIAYSTESILFSEEVLENLLDEKRGQGYNCTSSQLFT